MNDIVKRIDKNVSKLDKAILGDEQNSHVKTAIVTETNAPHIMSIEKQVTHVGPPVVEVLHGDEFNKKAEKARKDMHAHFDELKKALEDIGIGI